MRKLTTIEFIEKAINVHGNEYDYSLVNYNGGRNNVDIICKKHGIFSQNPRHHVERKSNCPKCRNEYLSQYFASNAIDFIFKANELHKNMYGYSNVEYINAFTDIKIECFIHGIFSQRPNNHLNGAGCPSCKESHGEKKVAEILKKNNILFEREITFSDLKDKSNLFYDFYLPDHKLFIEYDGIQHYKSVPFFGGEDALNENRKRDIIKFKYAMNNGYKLLKIRFIPPKYLEEALVNQLKRISVL
jgi:very-short-patch-repair endonuclease